VRSAKVEKFEDLLVWQRAKELSLAIYQVTAVGSFSKDYGLRDQIQRAAVSAMSNIAEGFERYSRQEFKQFLSVARGSVAEVRSQLYLARDLRYIDDKTFAELSNLCFEMSRMLGALRTSLNQRQQE
jgi:four helix bundle protein